jgi:hypothetical protein
MNLTNILQVVTLAVLLFGIYTLDKAGNDRENQNLIWLEDAEKDRAAQMKRIRSIEVFLMKRTEYTQTE